MQQDWYYSGEIESFNFLIFLDLYLIIEGQFGTSHAHRHMGNNPQVQKGLPDSDFFYYHFIGCNNLFLILHFYQKNGTTSVTFCITTLLFFPFSTLPIFWGIPEKGKDQYNIVMQFIYPSMIPYHLCNAYFQLFFINPIDYFIIYKKGTI